jgi:putative copper resistance protein D
MDDPLIWVRAIHFAATILVSGVMLFAILIAEPTFRKADGGGQLSPGIRVRLTWLAWVALIVVLLSGAAWLFCVAAQMADLPLPETLTDPAVWTVLTQTDFGHVWMVRLVLAGLVTVALRLLPNARAARSYWTAFLIVLLAAALTGTLAWSGHAAAGTGYVGAVHLVSDILHLVAAATWLGALVPLAFMLAAATQSFDKASAVIAREAVLRFSTVGIASVGTLLATGIINSWMLVGSMAALVGTTYGHLLLVKIALFFCMLAVAGINRLILTPRLIGTQGVTAQFSARQLGTNSLIEAGLGAAILLVVGVLGILQPAIEG